MFKKLSFSLILLVILSGAAMAQQIQEITLHCPVYLLWQGYESYILVRNTTGSDVEVMPAFCFDGDRLAPLTMVPIPAHGTVIWTAEQFLGTSSCTTGLMGVELAYAGEQGAMMASVIILSDGPPPLSLQVPFKDASTGTSRTLHSCIWLGGEFIDCIFVKNTTDNPVIVSPVFYCGAGSVPGFDVGLGPYQTAMLKAGEGFGPAGDRIGGADLYSNGPAGSIVAINAMVNRLNGLCLVEEMLPGRPGGVPSTYNLFVANGLSYTLSAINTTRFDIKANFASTGDVPNYLVLREDRLYCVNSLSNNVQVFSPETGDLLSVIELDVGSNPYTMAFASDDKAYVSAWLLDAVFVINIPESDCRGAITLGPDAQKPQGLCIAEQKLYVTSTNFDLGDYSYGPGVVSVIDTKTDEIIKSIKTTQVNPQSIVYDNQGELYVLCTGDWAGRFGVVDVIDVATDEIVQSLPVGGSPGCIEIAPNGYAYIGDAASNSLFKIDVVENTVVIDSSSPIRFGSQDSWTSGLVSSSDGHLYIASFNDDNIYILDCRTDSIIRMTYPVGDGPGAMAVRH